MNDKIYIYSILTGLFCAALCIGVAIGSKLINVFGVAASLSAFTYPFTFFVTDTVGEVFGKSASQKTVFAGFLSLVLMLVITQIAIWIPGADFYEFQSQFQQVFGSTYRYIIGGTLAYLISQYFDVWFFHFLKKKFNGKKLWLRNNLSTIISQFLDSSIFIVIGFAGNAPILPLIAGQFLLKVFLAVLDTPFIYLAVRYIKNNYEVDTTL